MTDEPRVLLISSDHIGVGVTASGAVSINFGRPHASLGIDAAVELATELDPNEARLLAALLVRKADEAEASRG